MPAAVLLLAITITAARPATPHRPVPRSAPAVQLPDSAVIARVDTRPITVYDFRERWFSSDPTARPHMDSLGRVEFLHSLVDKEVLSLEALKAGTRLTPSDEWSLRGYEEKLLTLRLYQLRVEEPGTPTEQQMHAIHDLMGWRMRLRYLLFADRETAQGVRSQLASGRITWEAAAKRAPLTPDSLVRGDLGWTTLGTVPTRHAATVFALRPPLYSEVLLDEDGYRVWQCLERQSQPVPPFASIRRTLWIQARYVNMAPLEAAFFEDMARRVAPAYDTTNIVWLADRFEEANRNLGDVMSGLDLRTRVPVIPAADTSRVLARVGNQVYSAARLIAAYTDIPPMRRNRIVTPSALFGMLERMVLAPTIAQAAREQGVDRAPDVVAEMRKQREGMLVGHMYDDSVQARMTYDPRANRRWYEAHRKDYVLRDHVRYALLLRATEAGADSLGARLAAGESAQAIWSADSAAGWRGGGLRDLYAGQGHTYYHMLMEELHEKQWTKEYLGGDKVWAVFYIVRHETPRPMAYEEVADIVGQTLENAQAEKLLKDMIARLRRRHRIVQHPELLMRIRLEDPTGDMPARAAN
jgi:peptidyl-prolyl cis-trans isomerase C